MRGSEGARDDGAASRDPGGPSGAAHEERGPGSTDLAPGRTARWIWIACGWASLALAIVGVFLPLVPTTPLVLLAAWCFSRGSQRLHRWLLEHRHSGPMIRDWERHRVIRLRAKILATATIVPLVGYMLIFSAAPGWTKIVTALLVAYGLTFVWTKPSEPAGT